MRHFYDFKRHCASCHITAKGLRSIALPYVKMQSILYEIPGAAAAIVRVQQKGHKSFLSAANLIMKSIPSVTRVPACVAQLAGHTTSSSGHWHTKSWHSGVAKADTKRLSTRLWAFEKFEKSKVWAALQGRYVYSVKAHNGHESNVCPSCLAPPPSCSFLE